MRIDSMTFKCLSACALLFLASFSGCGPGGKPVAPVSGIVTIDGDPAANIELIFTPEQIEGGTANVGPYSIGQTDASGKYILTTRDGVSGAVVGKHAVTFNYAGPDPEEALSEAKMGLQEAKAEGDESRVSKLKSEIEKLKKAKVMPDKYSGSSTTIFGTVIQGENKLDFALSSDTD